MRFAMKQSIFIQLFGKVNASMFLTVSIGNANSMQFFKMPTIWRRRCDSYLIRIIFKIGSYVCAWAIYIFPSINLKTSEHFVGVYSKSYIKKYQINRYSSFIHNNLIIYPCGITHIYFSGKCNKNRFY